MTARELRLPENWPRQVRSAVVHAVSMAHTAFSTACGRVEHRFDELVRLRADNDRLHQEISLLLEELRIKNARMEKLTPQRRPHYPAVERLAILELRAARGWSLAQTARRMLVTPLTVVSWMHRLDDEGPDALVQVPEPVNRFPDFVGYLIRRLKALCPRMGSRRIARVLARASLHIADAPPGSEACARIPSGHDARRDCEAPEPRLARGPHDRADDRRILDLVGSDVTAATVAVLLVGGGRRGPLLTQGDGHRALQEGADGAGSDPMLEEDMPDPPLPPRPPDHRPRTAVHGRRVHGLVPEPRHSATLRSDRQVRQHCRDRAVHPHSQERLHAPATDRPARSRRLRPRARSLRRLVQR